MAMLVLSSFYLLRNYCVIANPILISNPGIMKILVATVPGWSLKHSEPFATSPAPFQYWLSNTFIWRHQTSARQRLQQELVDNLMPWIEGLAD